MQRKQECFYFPAQILFETKNKAAGSDQQAGDDKGAAKADQDREQVFAGQLKRADIADGSYRYDAPGNDCPAADKDGSNLSKCGKDSNRTASDQRKGPG